MRDKTLDDRFFILTLFAVAMEAEKQMLNAKDMLLQTVLPVGLHPKHYGALYRKFEDYFKNRGIQQFIYKGISYRFEIVETAAFPQDYAAAMTVYQKIAHGMNNVWVKMAEFLGRLNGESVSRESYVRTPEYEKTLEVWKGTGMGGLSGNPFRRTEGKAGGNKRVSGGLFFCPGVKGIYSRLCGLCAGIVSYGIIE